MSLTPKNWNSFQHYKDRSPAWIKLHRGLLDDYEYSCLPTASRALAPLLWLLASEFEDGKITASFDEISFRLRMNSEDLRASIEPLIAKGFFVDDSKLLARRKRGAIPEREREKKETQDKREREKESCAVATATRTSDWPPDWQIQFWQQYPKRIGKKAAIGALDRVRLKAAVPWDALMAAVMRYSASVQNSDPKYVKHPATWINAGCWDDEIPANGGQHGRSLSDRAAALAEQIRSKERPGGSGGSSDVLGGDDAGGPIIEGVADEGRQRH